MYTNLWGLSPAAMRAPHDGRNVRGLVCSTTINADGRHNHPLPDGDIIHTAVIPFISPPRSGNHGHVGCSHGTVVSGMDFLSQES